jgi:O-antigen/teichoic acid export membrane protein
VTLANKTIGNAIAGIIGYVWPLALALLTTPYIVHKLGNDAYGILSLVTSVLGFLAFLDLGVTNAATKYIAESNVTNDTHEINRIVGVSITVYLAVGIIGGSLIALLTPVLVGSFLKIPPEYRAVSTFAFYVASCGFALNMMIGVFASIPKAIQRYDLSTKVNMLISTLLTAGIVALLYAGFGLRQVVILNLLSSAVGIVLFISISKRHVPGLMLSLTVHRDTLRKLFRFGMYSLITTICASIVFHLDRLLIGSFLGSAAVTFYAIPFSIVTGLIHLIVSLTAVVFPLSSHLHASGAFDTLRALYLKSSKFAFILIVSLATPVIVLAHPIMSIWMGPEYGLRSTPVLVILAVSSVFIAVGSVPSSLLYGVGMPGVNAKLSLLSAGLSLALLLVLIPRFGLVGAAVANAASFVIAVLYLVVVDRLIIHHGLFPMIKDLWAKPLLLCLLQAAITHFALSRLIHGFAGLVLAVALSVGFFYSTLLFFKVLTDEDLALFKQYALSKLNSGGKTG